MKTIGIGEMLSEMNMPDAIFSIKYRKDDGSVGTKINVKARGVRNVITERRKYNRNGVIAIYVPASGEDRDITIDLIIEFNGMRVVRPTIK